MQLLDVHEGPQSLDRRSLQPLHLLVGHATCMSSPVEALAGLRLGRNVSAVTGCRDGWVTIRAAEWVTLVSDFFDNQSGLVRRVRLKTPTPWCLDLLGDLQLRRSRRLAALKAARGPRQRILAVGVAVPSRPGRLEAIMRTLSDTRHHLDCVTFPMKLAPAGFSSGTWTTSIASHLGLVEDDTLL